ncbi:MAG: hypothetical protein WCD89_20340, partial [Anaerocolumna sp.]
MLFVARFVRAHSRSGGCVRLNLVLNRDSGTLREGDPATVAKALAEIFEAHGHSAATQVLRGSEAIAAIDEA